MATYETLDGFDIVQPVTCDGLVAVTNSSGIYDLTVVRVTLEGELLWARRYSGASPANAILPAADGGWPVAGMAYSEEHNSGDGVILKLDANGAPLWQKRLGGGDSAFAVALAAMGGTYLLTGFTLVDPSICTWAAAVDPAGNVLWHKAYDSPTDDFVLAANADPNGGFVLAGASRANSGYVGWLARLDVSGNVLWQRRYAANQADYVRNVAPSGGGYILGGSSGVCDFPGWPLYVCGSGEIGGCPPVGEVGLVAFELAFDSSPTNATIGDTAVAALPAEVLERTVAA